MGAEDAHAVVGEERARRVCDGAGWRARPLGPRGLARLLSRAGRELCGRGPRRGAVCRVRAAEALLAAVCRWGGRRAGQPEAGHPGDAADQCRGEAGCWDGDVSASGGAEPTADVQCRGDVWEGHPGRGGEGVERGGLEGVLQRPRTQYDAGYASNMGDLFGV